MTDPFYSIESVSARNSTHVPFVEGWVSLLVVKRIFNQTGSFIEGHSYAVRQCIYAFFQNPQM